MRKTPLYESHVALGGKIIDFGGWALPVQYSSILKEHQEVRTAAGLFDVSHMGEIIIEGKNAGEYIQGMVTNDISKMLPGRVVYSPMCYVDGGTVDDLLIYKLDEDRYLLVVNAANTQKDFQWLRDNCAIDGIAIEDLSEDYGLIAIQGPYSQRILQKLTAVDLDEIRFFRFMESVEIGHTRCLVSRTGYTGEDGFELYMPARNAAGLWDMLLDAGSEEGIVPAGLGARDTLRFEVALPLYGQELSPTISPLEAGMERFVKLDKNGFIGQDALKKQAADGLERKLIGLEMLDRGIPRTGYKVILEGKQIGFVTSGGRAPSLNKNLGLALVDSDHATLDHEIFIEIRGKALRARTIARPFYTKG